MNAQTAIHPAWETERLPCLSFDSKVDSSVNDGVQIQALCIAGRDWSMKNLYTQGDADVDRELADAISWELAERGIERAYGPSVGAMSGVMVPSERLSSQILLAYNNEIWRNKEIPSEGIPLQPGEAFIGTLGGCGAGVLTWPGGCLAFHIGRDSALDRNDICGLGPSREHFSVVDAAVRMAIAQGATPEQMTFRCLFTLPQRAFGHPRRDHAHEKYNRYMGNYIRAQYGNGIGLVEDDTVYLDMHELAASQAQKHGVRVDRAADRVLPYAGEFGHTGHPHLPMKNQRNLVIVHRIS